MRAARLGSAWSARSPRPSRADGKPSSRAAAGIARRRSPAFARSANAAPQRRADPRRAVVERQRCQGRLGRRSVSTPAACTHRRTRPRRGPTAGRDSSVAAAHAVNARRRRRTTLAAAVNSRTPNRVTAALRRRTPSRRMRRRTLQHRCRDGGRTLPTGWSEPTPWEISREPNAPSLTSATRGRTVAPAKPTGGSPQ